MSTKTISFMPEESVLADDFKGIIQAAEALVDKLREVMAKVGKSLARQKKADKLEERVSEADAEEEESCESEAEDDDSPVYSMEDLNRILAESEAAPDMTWTEMKKLGLTQDDVADMGMNLSFRSHEEFEAYVEDNEKRIMEFSNSKKTEVLRDAV